MKRINYYLLLLATMLCVSSLNAQKEYSIDCVTVINLGDGRILHRDISGNKPLNGEHRIIDGYHSALPGSKMVSTMVIMRNMCTIS